MSLAWSSWASVVQPSSHFQDSQDVPGLQAVRPGAPFDLKVQICREWFSRAPQQCLWEGLGL